MENSEPLDDPPRPELGLVLDQPLLTKPADVVLDGFGSGQASPGSGSAAALMGLLAAKLIITVCSKSLEKETSKEDQKHFEYIRGQCHIHYQELRELFESDARDFRQVIELKKARDLEASTEEKAKLQRQANDLLEKTTDYVLLIVEKCRLLAEHGLTVFDRGWKYVRGDSGAAISAGIGGIMSGIFILGLNLKLLKERQYARDHASRPAELYGMVEKLQARAFGQVTSLSAEAIEAIQMEFTSGS